MTSQNSSRESKRRCRSISGDLERLAWQQNPRLAGRLSRRRARLAQTGHRRDDSVLESSNRIMRWQDRILLTLGLVLLVLFVIRAETAAAGVTEWGLHLQGDHGEYTELALDTDIRMDITGLVARVEVSQKFTNHGAAWAEGIYRFPLPADAAVDRLLVRVGERLLEGEIQEKQTARQTYQRARDSGRTATIVEQQRRNQFETRLANIGPGESVEITIGFLQNVSYSDATFRLRLPMTFTPRWERGARAHAGNPAPRLTAAANPGGHRLSLVATLVSAAGLTSIESQYHDVDIRKFQNGYRIELLNPDASPDRDFELSWTPELQAGPSASLTTFNDGDSVYAQLMLAPPLGDYLDPVAREVVLVIDTSGSMEGASLSQAKSALLHALDSLGADDHFNLLQFNSVTESLFDRSVPATPANRYAARDFIGDLEANGGTDMAPALDAALSMPQVPGLMRQVVFITDGAVGNETGLLQMVARQLGDSRLFTVAIGPAPNGWFMRKAAEIGRGSHVPIGKSQEVGERMDALWGRIRQPALTDICVNWGQAAEFYPEVIPDLYAGEPLWLLARLPSEPTIISLCGNFNGREWNLDVNAWDAAAAGPGGDNLAKLWARKKIEALEDGLLFGADAELTRLETTALALDYGLLTRHTSLVAVDKTPRRSAAEMLASSEVPGLLPLSGGTQTAAFPATATGWLSQALLSLLVLSLASAMLVFSGSRLPMMKPQR